MPVAFKLLNRPGARRVADTVLADPEQHTVMDPSGAVRSIQAAYLHIPARELERVWNAMHLERLARTYWRYLSRVTLGLIRVAYTREERTVVFLRWPLVLLRFYAPEYELDPNRGIVRWRIRDGFLVSRRGRGGNGYLEIDVRRCRPEREGYETVHVEVEVANFYPAIASGLSRWAYQATQSRIHVLVTHGFLRSLARLELEKSKVGRFAAAAPGAPGGPTPEPGAERPSPHADGTGRGAPVPLVTAGSTPWAVWAGIAALVGVGLAVGLARDGRNGRRAGLRRIARR